MDATCSMDVQLVKGAKNLLFGNEGVFHIVITGTGDVVVQSMTVKGLAARIMSALSPQEGN